MSGTIYGGKTRNGVIIQDMIDDNRDYVYRNKKIPGFFARFAQSILREDDTEFTTAGPAIAIFSNYKPFEPIWGRRLHGSFEDYTDGWSMNEKFITTLEDVWEEFAKFRKEDK